MKKLNTVSLNNQFTQTVLGIHEIQAQSKDWILKNHLP